MYRIMYVHETFLSLYKNSKGFYDNCPRGKLRPNPKTIPKSNLNPNRGRGGQFSSGAIVWLSPNPRTNSDLDINHNLNRDAIFLGRNCPDNEFPDFSSSEKVQFTFCAKQSLRFVWNTCFLLLGLKISLHWILDDEDEMR